MARRTSVPAKSEDRFLLRALLAIVGGYVFASGACACLALGLAACGVTPAQAAESALLAAILVFLAAGLAAFADRPVFEIAIILVGCGALLGGIAIALRHMVAA